MNRALIVLLALALTFSAASATVLLDNGANSTTGWISLDALTAGSITIATDTGVYESAPASLKIVDGSNVGGSYRRYWLAYTDNATAGSTVNATFYGRGSTNGASLHEWCLRSADSPSTNNYVNDVAMCVLFELGAVRYRTHTSGSAIDTGVVVTADTWHKFSIVYDVDSGGDATGLYDIYVNDALEASGVEYSYANVTPYGISFQATGSTQQGTTFIDSIFIVDDYTPPANVTYAELTLSDAYDGSSITTFNATINGSTYTTNNGTIITNITTNTTSLYTITFTSEDYFANTSSNVNLSSGSYEGSVTQAWVRFACFELYTNASLDCDEAEQYPRQAGSYTDTVNVTGYFGNPTSYTISALDSTPTFTYTAGGWANPEYLFDGDFLTYSDVIISGSPPFESGEAFAYWNYTQLTDTTVSLRQGGTSTTSYIVPSSCLEQSPIQFYAQAKHPEIGTIATRFYCYNGTAWQLVAEALGAARFYEHEFTNTRLPVESRGFYDFNLTVQANDYAGNPETDFISLLNSSALGINFENTTNGTSITYPLLSGYEYTSIVNATSTIYGDPVNQLGTATITNTTTSLPQSLTYEYNLTAARQISVTIYYEENLSIFSNPTNITLVPLTDDSNLYFNTTTSNGSAVLYNIPVNAYRILAESTGYHDETRYFVLGTYTGQNITLYFRENDTGADRTFYAVNSQNVLQNGWYLRYQRNYNGTGWLTVDESRTNIDGIAVQNLLTTEYYRIILLNDEFEEQYRSERTFLLEDQYQVSPSTTVVSSTQINKTLGVSGRVVMNNSTITGYGTSTSGVREWRLDLYRYYTDGIRLVNSTSGSSDAVTLTLATPAEPGRYEAVLLVIGSEIPIATNGLNTNAGPASLGSTGALYALVLLIGIVGIGVFSAPAALIMSILAIIVSNLMGILSISTTAIVGIIIVAGMVIYRRASA